MKLILFTFLTIINFKSFAQLTFTEYPCNTNGSSFPWALQVFKNNLYFAAAGNTGGLELWSFDGYSNRLLKDINTTTLDASSGPGRFVEINDKLLFTADDGINGREFWITDGTSSGTKLFIDIYPGSLGGDPYDLVNYKSKLFFGIDEHKPGGSRFWFTDGTLSGTSFIKKSVSVSTRPNITLFKEKIFFSGNVNNIINTYELWSSDGTASGTNLVKDIRMGDTGSNPSFLFVYENNLYFNANDGINGNELWVSDGTNSGTKLFMDIHPGLKSSNPKNFTIYDGKLFFSADDGIRGNELWVTDGTTSGTHLVKDINTNTGSFNGSNPYGMTEYNGKLYFQAFSIANGIELWRTDGTDAGTILVKDINPGTQYSYPIGFIVYGSKLYFTADTDSLGIQLYQTDGTDTGTILINPTYLPLSKNAIQAYPYFVIFKDKLFFKASYRNNESQLWSISDLAVGIKKNNLLTGIKMYPNPTRNIINIEGLELESTITISNSLGQILLKTKNITTSHIIDLSTYPNCIYNINVINSNGKTYNDKFVKIN